MINADLFLWNYCLTNVQNVLLLHGNRMAEAAIFFWLSMFLNSFVAIDYRMSLLPLTKYKIGWPDGDKFKKFFQMRIIFCNLIYLILHFFKISINSI